MQYDNLMLILLVASFGLLWIYFTTNKERFGYANLSVRGSLLLAFLAFELILLAITELTSVGHHFTFGIVSACWILTIMVLLFATRGQIRQFALRVRSPDGTWVGLRKHVGNLDVQEWIWISVVVAIFGMLVVNGAMYPPSNSDAMVYHLPRVEHWIQNRTIAPYAAHYLAQIELSPLSEYNLAHLHLMAGTDRFDAAVQLFSAAVAVVGVTELARLLGGTRWAQVMSAVVCATIPIGILLATSAENDYGAAATGLTLIVLVVAFRPDGHWVVQSLVVGAAAGLSYLAKGTMPTLVGPPVFALFCVAAYRYRKKTAPLSVAKIIGLILGGVTIVTLPFSIQNYQLFDSVVGPTSQGTLVKSPTLQGAGANITRLTAANFDIGNGRTGIDHFIAQTILPPLGHLYSVFGIAPADPRYSFAQPLHTFAAGNYSVKVRSSAVGANPWHVLALVASLIVLVIAMVRGRKEVRVPLVLASGLTVGYLIFAGLTRWSSYGIRYELPLLVAWSVIIALATARFPRWVGHLVMTGLVVASLPQLIDNKSRPLYPSDNHQNSYLLSYFEQRFVLPTQSAREAAAYQTITDVVAQSTCTRVALGNWVLFEYPLWVGLHHHHWHGTLDDFGVKNVTRRLSPHYVPCAKVTQQGAHYVTPSNGTVNVKVQNLAASINASNAQSITASIAGFSSRVRGVQVLPGGGWRFTKVGNSPQLLTSGTLYLFASRGRTVQLGLRWFSRKLTASLKFLGSPGQNVATTSNNGTMTVRLDLHSGVNRFDLVNGGPVDAAGGAMTFSGVQVSQTVQP